MRAEAGVRAPRPVEFEHPRRRLLQGDVYPVAFALDHRPVKRRHGRPEGVNRTEAVRLAAARHQRLARRVARQRHQPAHREGDDVGRLVRRVWPGLSERRHGDDNQRRFLLPQAGRAHPPACERPRFLVFDHNIRRQRERAQLPRVGRDAPFAREQVNLFIGGQAFIWWVNAHHIRPEPGQPARRERRREAPAHFKHAHTFEQRIVHAPDSTGREQRGNHARLPAPGPRDLRVPRIAASTNLNKFAVVETSTAKLPLPPQWDSRIPTQG